MPKDKPKAVKIYSFVGAAGALLLAVGCFCPIDAYSNVSPASMFLIGLSALGNQQSLEAGAKVILAFWMLFIAGRSVLGAALGEVQELRVTSVQAWVVIIFCYWFYFGTPLPFHLGAGWGWSVLYLGATLLSFGSFRLAMELEDDEDKGKTTPRKRN